MSKRLEQFVKDNREDFDKFEPGPVVWHNIQQQLKKGKAGKEGILISMRTIRWAAAASVIVLLGAGAYFFSQPKKTAPGAEIAGTQHRQQPANAITNNLPKPAHDSNQATAPDSPSNSPRIKNNDDTQLAAATDEYNEEIYHYTRLVELKQNEIKKVTKDEPLLYQQFAGDINKLDSAFHTLRKQLPVNPNREQLLEAMLDNLHLQEALLNRQLNIIKQINKAKKAEYEKVYKTS